MSGLCEFPGCDRPGRNGRGLCNSHRAQRIRGVPLTPLRVKKPNGAHPGICSFEGCGKRVHAKGLCAGHRSQLLEGRGLSPLLIKAAPGAGRTICTIEGCGKPIHGGTLCVGHLAMKRRKGSVKALRYTLPRGSRPANLTVSPRGVAAARLDPTMGYGKPCPVLPDVAASVLDHDHQSGRLRGFLSRRANGFLPNTQQEFQELILRLIRYFEKCYGTDFRARP